MSIAQHYLDDAVFSFRKQKEMAEKAINQVSDDNFFKRPGEFSNSIALIVKHLAGNLTSRWTDFLTTDGEKPNRNRDSEFVIGANDSRQQVLASWEAGWSVLFATLASLSEIDLLKDVKIRGEVHTVLQAINRALTHTSYHTGQIVYLARMLTTGDWQWITIPPGKTKEYKAQGQAYLK